jgi:hypothetical protein
VIEGEYFHRLREAKGFARAVTSLGDRRGRLRDWMNEKAKRDMPGSTPPLVGARRVLSAQSYAALAAMADGIRRKIILPEIISFRKVAL